MVTTFHLTYGFSDPFFTGVPATSEVPGRYPVAIAGRPYMVDTKAPWREESVPLLRAQADQSPSPSEISLNPDALWRRSTEGWHHGAGQNYHDSPESDPLRFRTSKGIDVWTRKQAGLLPSVDQKKTSSNTNLKIIPCGSRLFCVDGADVTYTEDVTADSPTWTNCTNEPGGTILDIASDGHYVWITDGSNSFWADSTAAPPAFNLAGWTGTQDADSLAFVKGRLLSGHDNTLAYYDAAGVATLITMGVTLHTSFAFVGFAGSPTTNHIYAAGFSGDKSLILRTAVNENGTALDPAIVAAELPDGEIVRSISAYLNFVLIGTDKGVRLAVPSSGGDLTVGALLSTGSPCRCFEGQGPHVWFGWDNFDSLATGLGRLSLEEFAGSDNLAPAYASDILAGQPVSGVGTVVQGAVLSVATFQSIRVFTVSGKGVFAQDTPLVGIGFLASGRFTYGLTEAKTALSLEVRHRSMAGSSAVSLSTDGAGSTATVFGAGFNLIGVLTADGTLPTGESRGREFELLFTLSRSESATTTGPLMSSVTLLAAPAANRTRVHIIPLLLHRRLKLPGGGEAYQDPEFEYQSLVGYWASGELVAVQRGNETFTAIVEDYEFSTLQFAGTQGGGPSGVMEGTLSIRAKEISSGV